MDMNKHLLENSMTTDLVNQGDKLNKEVVDTLFSKDREKLLMITDLSGDDLIWATAFQSELRFLVDDFVNDNKLKRKCYKFMEDIYKMRVSKDRKGRTELFDAIKSQNYFEAAGEKGFLDKLRGR